MVVKAKSGGPMVRKKLIDYDLASIEGLIDKAIKENNIPFTQDELANVTNQLDSQDHQRKRAFQQLLNLKARTSRKTDRLSNQMRNFINESIEERFQEIEDLLYILGTFGEIISIPSIVNGYKLVEKHSPSLAKDLQETVRQALCRSILRIKPKSFGIHENIERLGKSCREFVSNLCTGWLIPSFLVYDDPDKAILTLESFSTFEEQMNAIQMLIQCEEGQNSEFLSKIIRSDVHASIRRQIAHLMLSNDLSLPNDISKSLDIQNCLLSRLFCKLVEEESAFIGLPVNDMELITAVLYNTEFNEAISIDPEIHKCNEILLKDDWNESDKCYQLVEKAINLWAQSKVLQDYDPLVPNLFNELLNPEQVLYGNLKTYRDHVVHSYRVFLLGAVIIWIRYALETPVWRKIDYRDDFCSMLKDWFLVSLLHDISYPLCRTKKVLNEIQERFEGIKIVKELAIASPLVFRPRFNGRVGSWISLMAAEDYAPHNSYNEDTLWKLYEEEDHGIWSALMLCCALDTSIYGHDYQNEVVMPEKSQKITRAMISHSQQDFSTEDFGLASLLCLVDELQEPARPRTITPSKGARVDPATTKIRFLVRKEKNQLVITLEAVVTVQDKRNFLAVFESILQKVGRLRRISFKPSTFEAAVRLITERGENQDAILRTVLIGKGTQQNGMKSCENQIYPLTSSLEGRAEVFESVRNFFKIFKT